MGLYMDAEIIDFSGSSVLFSDHGNIGQYLDQGKLLVYRKLLQEMKVYNPILNLIYKHVHAIAGNQIADELKASGLQNFHKHISPNSLEDIYSSIRVELANIMPAITAEIFRKLGIKEPFYIHDGSLIRLMYPYLETQGTSRKFKSSALGKLHPHGPHHDYFQNVPFNSVNIWTALTPTDHTNGMLLYPDVWGKNIPKGDEIAQDGYDLGNQFWIKLEPGDSLIFHSNHLHSTQINSSNTTRVTLTNRICLKKPIFPSLKQRQKYFLSSAFSDIKPIETSFSIHNFNGDQRQTFKETGRFRTFLERSKLNRRIRNAEKSLKLIKNRFKADSSSNSIWIVNKSKCAANIDGQVFEFSRFCPHEGADLALGKVVDKKVVCPHHGARFCLKEKTCEGIPSLKLSVKEKENF